MSEMEDNFFDLALCDPPYGAATYKKWSYDSDKNIEGFGGNWKINTQIWDLLKQDDSFCRTFTLLSHLKRLVKPTGSIWIHSTYHNSGFVNTCCQLLNLEIINEIVWYKRNAFPNLSARRLTASHETILWVHSGGKKREYFFNYEEVKNAKFREDNFKEPGKQLRTVWDIPNNKDKEELAFGKHPTQKPQRLIDRIMLIAAKRNGRLLVPFSGSGTEIIAGLKYNMDIVGYEINKEYFDLSINRIEHYLKSREGVLL
ncbi:MAG: site-specific DNA-methyltransferase [Candidatus Omnitrophica bacterium]|nr:site-specific DNA-methyltransferase [Candidatus Omnitrophota bacterium]